MHVDFLEKREAKKHNISTHSKRMRDKIKINHMPEQLKNINKRKIVKVDFWMNIWTEINGIRPAIIYKASSLKYWEDITVLPITSYKNEEQKTVDLLDIPIQENDDNWLKNKSLIKIRQLKSVSKKRFRRNKKSKNIDIIWEIKNPFIRQQINTQIIKMFGLDQLRR